MLTAECPSVLDPLLPVISVPLGDHYAAETVGLARPGPFRDLLGAGILENANLRHWPICLNIVK